MRRLYHRESPIPPAHRRLAVQRIGLGEGDLAAGIVENLGQSSIQVQRVGSGLRVHGLAESITHLVVLEPTR
jgi:hypothetical protein